MLKGSDPLAGRFGRVPPQSCGFDGVHSPGMLSHRSDLLKRSSGAMLFWWAVNPLQSHSRIGPTTPALSKAPFSQPSAEKNAEQINPAESVRQSEVRIDRSP